MTNALKNIPGLAVCLALALPCWFVGQQFPIIGGPRVRHPDRHGYRRVLEAAHAVAACRDRHRVFSGKKVLQAAVAVGRVELAQIAQVGMMSLPIIGSTIATALIVAFF